MCRCDSWVAGMLVTYRYSRQICAFLDIECNTLRPLRLLRRGDGHGVTGLILSRLGACPVLIGHGFNPFSWTLRSTRSSRAQPAPARRRSNCAPQQRGTAGPSVPGYHGPNLAGMLDQCFDRADLDAAITAGHKAAAAWRHGRPRPVRPPCEPRQRPAGQRGWPAVSGIQGRPWTADYIDAIGQPVADLQPDIAAEARAKIVYERLIKQCDDAGAKDTLTFLMTREVAHQKMFEAALDAIEGNFPPGALPGSKKLGHAYVADSGSFGEASGIGRLAEANSRWGFELGKSQSRAPPGRRSSNPRRRRTSARWHTSKRL